MGAAQQLLVLLSSWQRLPCRSEHSAEGLTAVEAEGEAAAGAAKRGCRTEAADRHAHAAYPILGFLVFSSLRQFYTAHTRIPPWTGAAGGRVFCVAKEGLGQCG